MTRSLLGLVATFVVALGVVGLTFAASVGAPAELRFANGTEPQTLDPHLATGEPEGNVILAIFEGLTRLEAKSLRPVPGVAERWDTSADGKTWVFHLRRDARWTDGTPVTARDFVFGWSRLLSPEQGAEYAYLLYPVRFAEARHAFDARADTLESKLLPALDALATGAQAVRVQRILADTHAHDALARDPSEALATLLARRGGAFSAADVADLAGHARRVAADLRADAREARARLGKDAGFFARDDHTFVVELRSPTAYFLDLTAFYPTMPAPRHVVAAHPRDWFLPEHLVANGPFRLARWVVNDHIRLERSPTYWGRDAVRLRSIDAVAMENQTTALNLYLTGELDWLPKHYPVELAHALRRRPDFYETPALAVYYYRFNVTRPPFGDRRVRRAFNHAVDRRPIVEHVLGLGQIPATTFVPPGLRGYEPPASSMGHDPEAARVLLAEAGYPEGRGFPEVGILFNTLESHRKIAEAIADQLWKTLGVRVKPYNQEWQSFLSTVRMLDYTMARAAWNGDYQDPNTFLDMWVTNGGNNQTGWASPAYDRWIRWAADPEVVLADPAPARAAAKEPSRFDAALDAVRSGADRPEALARFRMHLLREAEAILAQDEMPILPIYFYVASGLVHPSVRGFYSQLEQPDGTRSANLLDNHPLRDVWIEGGPRR